jgi:hypothetical protein
MRSLTILLALLGGAAASADGRPEVFCTDGNGDRVELGELTCIAAGCVPPYLARCEMSLNSPMWRKVDDGCPAVSRVPARPAASTATARSVPG